MDNTFRFGVRGHDVPGGSVEEWAANIRKAGFCSTQLAIPKVFKERFNTSPTAFTSGLALYMRECLAAEKVNVAVLGCYYNLATPDKEALKKNQNLYKNHIRFASLLGCGMVGTETGAVNTEYKYEPANHTDEALEIFIDGLRPVVDYAEKMGVCVGIEPVYKHIMCNPARTRKVLDAIDSPNLRVILDPINMLSADNEQRHNDIVDEAFELFGEEIDVIHLKDYVVENGQIISRPITLGTGRFDIPHLFAKIKKDKPYINVLLEDSIPENVNISKAYAEKVYSEC